MARLSLLRISFLVALLAFLTSVSSTPFWPVVDEFDTVFRRADTGSAESSPSSGGAAPTTTDPITSPSTTPTPPTTTPPTTTTPTQVPTTTTPTTTDLQTTAPTTKPTTIPTLITTSSPVIQQSTVFLTSTVLFTDSNGSTMQSIVTSATVMSSTASYSAAVVTNPALTGSEGSSSSASSGLSDSSKKIIGGVVGGIGGLALLAGIAFVAFRIWGRDRYDPDDDLDYAAGTGQGLSSSGATDKLGSSGLASDEAHSDRYNTMSSSGRPNAAANF